MTAPTPTTTGIDADRLADFEHTLRTMLQDRVPPVSYDDISVARHAAFTAALEAALARIDAGTYGSCGRCGDPIAIERLEVVPTADRCQPCNKSS